MRWKIEQNFLTKEFEFSNFKEAINFINKVSEIAENQNHHPDILIHSYKKVKIKSMTHSENKVTTKDYNLAEEIDKLDIT